MKKLLFALLFLSSVYALEAKGCMDAGGKEICFFEQEMDFSKPNNGGEYESLIRIDDLLDLAGITVEGDTLLYEDPSSIQVEKVSDEQYKIKQLGGVRETYLGENCAKISERFGGNAFAIIHSPACSACYPNLAIKFVPATNPDLALIVRVPITCINLDTVFLLNGLSERKDVRNAVRSYVKNTKEKVKLVDYSSALVLAENADASLAEKNCFLSASVPAESIQNCVMTLKNNYFAEDGSRQLIIIGDEVGLKDSKGIIPAYKVDFLELSKAQKIGKIISDYNAPSDRAFDGDWLNALKSGNFLNANNFLIIGRIPFDSNTPGSEKMLEAIAAGQQDVSSNEPEFFVDKCGTSNPTNCHLFGLGKSIYFDLFGEVDESVFKLVPDYCVDLTEEHPDICNKKGELFNKLSYSDLAIFSLHGSGTFLAGIHGNTPFKNNEVKAFNYAQVINLKSTSKVVFAASCFGASLDIDNGNNFLNGFTFFEQDIDGVPVMGSDGNPMRLDEKEIRDKSLARAFLSKSTISLIGFSRASPVSIARFNGKSFYSNLLFSKRSAYIINEGVSIGEAFNFINVGNVIDESQELLSHCNSELGVGNCAELLGPYPMRLWSELTLRILGMPNTRLVS